MEKTDHGMQDGMKILMPLVAIAVITTLAFTLIYFPDCTPAYDKWTIRLIVMINWIPLILATIFWCCLRRNGMKTIITQHNDANRDLWQEMKEFENHAVLFDKSGGRGQSPEQWSAPLPGVTCGYAGGLGPENLAFELDRIHVAANGSPFWIDMEGKLRTGSDKFDLDHAKACLDIAGQYQRKYVIEPFFTKQRVTA